MLYVLFFLDVACGKPSQFANLPLSAEESIATSGCNVIFFEIYCWICLKHYVLIYVVNRKPVKRRTELEL